jgi:hypothetical protein
MSNLPDFYNKEDGAIKGLVDGLATEIGDVTCYVNALRQKIFVGTADDGDLDKIGEYFNLTRYPGETDDIFRGRIKSFIPGFIGGGVKSSIITNLWNRYGWVVINVDDYTEARYVPKFLIRLTPVPAMTDLATGRVTWADYNTYISQIKAAGVGWDTRFTQYGLENLGVQESGPTIIETMLYEIYYDDNNALYDGNGMYGSVPGGIGLWDLTNWDDPLDVWA